VCRGAFEREIGFSKTRALRKRERERQTLDVVSDLPLKGKKRERRPTLLISPKTKRSARKERKKKRIDSQNITYRRKKEKELLKRKRVFFKRKERHFSSFLSLLSLTSPEGGAS